MFKHLLTILVALMLWVPNFASAADPKVAFIYVGPVGDGGWTYAHDLGRRHLEKMGVETTYVESVPETDSCLLYTSPSPRDVEESRMPSSA